LIEQNHEVNPGKHCSLTKTIKSESTDSSLQKSHPTEMFAIEGPRVSDEVDIFADEVGNALRTPTEWKGKEKEIKIIDTISVRSQRVPSEKSLPELPRPVVRSKWDEENWWNEKPARSRTRSSSLGRIGSFI
jgi:hypothetical protein